jgi:hypothetical protein
MATSEELSAAFGDETLRVKIEAQLVVIAAEIMSGGDTAAPYSQDAGAHELRLKWALEGLSRTGAEAVYLHKFLMGVNSDSPIATILGASDAAVFSNLRDSIDDIAAARFG